MAYSYGRNRTAVRRGRPPAIAHVQFSGGRPLPLTKTKQCYSNRPVHTSGLIATVRSRQSCKKYLKNHDLSVNLINLLLQPCNHVEYLLIVKKYSILIECTSGAQVHFKICCKIIIFYYIDTQHLNLFYDPHIYYILYILY